MKVIALVVISVVCSMAHSGNASEPLTFAAPNGQSSNADRLRLDPPPNSHRPSLGSGNPLWSMPLKTLSFTRERPIFSATRRPIPPTLATAVKPSPQTVQSRPLLTLIGAISGESDGIAIFLEDMTRAVIRLKVGENYSGWTLRLIKGREATMQHNQTFATMILPGPPSK